MKKNPLVEELEISKGLVVVSSEGMAPPTVVDLSAPKTNHLWRLTIKINPRGLCSGSKRSVELVTTERDITEAAAVAARWLEDKKYDELVLKYCNEVISL